MKILQRSFLIASLVCVGASPLLAQWIQSMDHSRGRVFSFLTSGNRLFAGTATGVYRSTDNGVHWTTASNGLPTGVYAPVLNIALLDSNLFAAVGYNGGVFRSTNYGDSWTSASSGLTTSEASALAIIDSNLFVGTAEGVFVSANYGGSWNPANNGLTTFNVVDLAVADSTLYASTYIFGVSRGGVSRSTNKGTGWMPIDSGLTNPLVYRIVPSGQYVFAGTYTGVFRSSNNGDRWVEVNNGLEPPIGFDLAVSDTNIFVGTSHGVYISENHGDSWRDVTTNLAEVFILSLTVSNGCLFAGTVDTSLYRRPVIEMLTSVDESTTGLPTDFRFYQNYPNPFNPTTTFSFNLPSRTFVSLKIHDLLGREVAVLLSQELPPGTHLERWNGRGLPSGVYFARIQAASFTATRRLILSK